MAISKTTSTSDNIEPEFWQILKKPPETDLERWQKIVAAAIDRMYKIEANSTKWKRAIKNPSSGKS